MKTQDCTQTNQTGLPVLRRLVINENTGLYSDLPNRFTCTASAKKLVKNENTGLYSDQPNRCTCTTETGYNMKTQDCTQTNQTGLPVLRRLVLNENTGLYSDQPNWFTCTAETGYKWKHRTVLRPTKPVSCHHFRLKDKIIILTNMVGGGRNYGKKI